MSRDPAELAEELTAVVDEALELVFLPNFDRRLEAAELAALEAIEEESMFVRLERVERTDEELLSLTRFSEPEMRLLIKEVLLFSAVSVSIPLTLLTIVTMLEMLVVLVRSILPSALYWV